MRSILNREHGDGKGSETHVVGNSVAAGDSPAKCHHPDKSPDATMSSNYNVA
jgi:hypothetical protein